MQAITAQFYGGPRDGDVCQLPKGHDVMCFPVINTDLRPQTMTDPGATISLATAQYRLAYTHGMPSLNDQGHHRFVYAGTW